MNLNNSTIELVPNKHSINKTLCSTSSNRGWLIGSNGKHIIESYAGAAVADHLKGKLVFDHHSKTWGIWQGTHWEMAADNSDAVNLIAKAVEIGCKPSGYRNRYRSSIMQQIVEHRRLPRAPCPVGVVPFLNGMLEISSGKINAATPENACDYVLPHKYYPEAICPNIDEWLLDSVGGDEETCLLLRAWFAALVRNIPLQRFLMLIGPGGTSKGVFERLALALIGQKNCATSTLSSLEKNRFELAKHYGKRLCLINEAGKHNGELNMLKAMTGGDFLPLERKHEQQQSNFIYTGAVLLASNDFLAGSDTGIERRRMAVRFDRIVTSEQKQAWLEQGGEPVVLHGEIPGFIRSLLDIPEQEIRYRVEKLSQRVREENVLGMRAGSSVAEWAMHCCDFDPAYETEVGRYKPGCHDIRSQLYPAYREWCFETGTRYVAQSKFTDALRETALVLGNTLSTYKHPKTRRTIIVGIKVHII